MTALPRCELVAVVGILLLAYFADNRELILVVGELFTVIPLCLGLKELSDFEEVLKVWSAFKLYGHAERVAEVFGDPCL